MTQPNDTSIPLGLCQCGCGGKTAIARNDWPAAGHVKGVPKRFMRGHNARIPTAVDWVEEDRGHKTPCRIWKRGKTEGYAQDYSTGTATLGHRVAYEREKGPIPKGMQLDHLCRQRDCVNPDHLEPVTNTVNTQRGAMARLNADKVRAIRTMVGTCSLRAIGRQFGVSHHTIIEIIRGDSWKNVH